jgi:hypothetical protein
MKTLDETLDSHTLLIPAWPGADHPDQALAAMAAMIRKPGTRRFTGERLAATWSPQRRLFSVRKWAVETPEAQVELRLEPVQLRWFRRQLWALAHGQEPRSWGWAGGRLLTVEAITRRGEPALRLRTIGVPGAWTGWVEGLVLSVSDLRTLLALLVTARGTVDRE